MGQLSAQAPEKRIIVEAENADEALRIVQAGVDIVQIDNMSSQELSPLIRKIRHIAPTVKVSAAGGINEANVAEYAATGADIIVLSSVYFGKPADIGVRILPKK
jgi:molybdenum transport protein